MFRVAGLSRLPQTFVLIFAVCLAGRAAAADDATLRLPLVGIGETAAEHVASVVANPGQRKLYVGLLSRDAARMGLRVYDLDETGQPHGAPRNYSDYPDELPAGHHSTVVCLLHDPRVRKLYLGVSGSHPTHARSLVMYSLDDRGEPTGRPEAFDHGNPNKACDALALHPTNRRLYAVGWGGEGVFVLDRDEQGRPIGTPSFQRTGGGYGASAFAIRQDGRKLYRGTYPSVVEVCDLDAAGNIAGQARPRAIPNGPQEYLRFVATDRGLYFRGPDKRLAWFTLDDRGEIVGDLHSADIPDLQAVAAAERPDRLLIAVAAGFTDAVTKLPVIHGVEVRELAINPDGSPGAVVRKTAPFVRAEAVSLSGGGGAALAAKSLGRGFLGNRIAGLRVRCTLVSLEPDGTPLPAVTPVAFGDEQAYLRFVVSKKHGRVYAVANEHVVSCRVDRAGADSPERKSCPNAAGPISLDDARGLLFIAMKDGSIETRKLDEHGVHAELGERLKTALASIGTLAVHPGSGIVYAIGQAADAAAKDEPADRVVSISAGGYSADAAIDAARGRLYVVGAYRGLENTSVWKLDERGRLADREPTWLADGIPVDKPEIRGVLASVRIDSPRRQLIATGAQENPTGPPAYLIVRDLDEKGDAVGEPRLHVSANPRGSCWTVAATDDGRAFFESGWGESTIFLRGRDERFKPVGESTVFNVGAQGKRQLELLTVGQRRFLLAGTFPSTLEIIPLRTQTEPQAAVQAEVTVESLRQPLGLMAAGQTSPWVNLDAALQNGIGPAVVRCTFSGAKVKRAVVRWEVARQVGDSLEPIRTAELSLVGNVAAVIVPKYGLDDPAELKSLVRTSAEEFARYREYARKYAVSPAERPTKLLVANGLIGLDSSELALEAGMETLALLGHNAAQIWNWPGVAPDVIRAAADRHGIRRFRDAVYNPPSYFHYNADLVRPESLDKWAAGFRDAAAGMGAKPGELALFHMADEPGWYFPAVTNEVAGAPRRLAVFREYLKSKGLTPADVGAANWDAVLPGRLSAATTLPQKRLFFWTTRFYAESLSVAFASATQSLQRQVNPNILTTSNLNNWPGRFYIPSPGAKLANNSDAGPDAGMGMPDWFDLGRKRAVTCIWSEDWFGDADAQLWSLYGDLLRCSAREGQIEYGGYPVGQSTGAMPDGAKLKIASLIGHGAKTIDPYIFGPNLAFADGWSEKEATYRNLAAAMRLLGKAERLLAPGRPPDGTVAIVFPQASQVWDGDSNSNAYLQELYGLHAALIHENYPVDFVDDFGIEAGDLTRRRYAAVYVTAPNLSVKAQRALVAWTAAGGTLVLAPGACAADEYNEPTNELLAKVGADQAAVPRIAPPHYTQAFRIARTPVAVSEPHIGVEASFAITQTVAIRPTDPRTQPLATFADGSIAAVSAPLGQGRVIAFGFWPGVSYWLSPDRSDRSRLPSDWSAAARSVATWPARQANAPRHVLVSEPGVEACLLESPAGRAITLLNWTGRPIRELRITIPGAADFKNAIAAEAGPLQPMNIDGHSQFVLPLDSADVLLLER